MRFAIPFLSPNKSPEVSGGGVREASLPTSVTLSGRAQTSFAVCAGCRFTAGNRASRDALVQKESYFNLTNTSFKKPSMRENANHLFPKSFSEAPR